jgi:predicted RNA binding protein YcfA (HicA-like mRNA interferase family)
MKNRDLKRMLTRRGWRARPGKGNHVVWSHPDHPEQRIVLSGGKNDDAHPYQIALVRKPRKQRHRSVTPRNHMILNRKDQAP